jgi:hypothetical protein
MQKATTGNTSAADKAGTSGANKQKRRKGLDSVAANTEKNVIPTESSNVAPNNVSSTEPSAAAEFVDPAKTDETPDAAGETVSHSPDNSEKEKIPPPPPQSTIRYRDNYFAVFIEHNDARENEDFYVRWIRKNDVFQEEPYCAELKSVERLLAKAQTIGAIPTPFLRKVQRETKARIIGEAVALALSGDVNAANQTLKDARNFINTKAEEQARIWTVQGALGAFLILTGILLLLAYNLPMLVKLYGGDLTVRELIVAASFGLIGGLFSLLQRVDRLGVAPLSGKNPHVIEASARVLTGALGGIIMYVLLRSQLIAGFIQHGNSQDVTTSEHWLTWALVIVAGVSERLIPNLMTKFETQAAGDLVVENGTQSPNSKT